MIFPELLLLGIFEVVGRDLSSGVEILFRNIAIFDDLASERLPISLNAQYVSKRMMEVPKYFLLSLEG